MNFELFSPVFCIEVAKNVYLCIVNQQIIMAKTPLWQDEYWLLLMQAYLKSPKGMKPTYSKTMVDLSMELHIAPVQLAAKMEQLTRLDTPRLERIWQTYAENPRRLARAIRLWREMKGFGQADDFYEGVEVSETFEPDFRPIEAEPSLTPVALILILNLYFQLIPQTMVVQTPEVINMGRLIGVPPTLVVNVLELYQRCDPYLKRDGNTQHPLLHACQQIWKRFEGKEPEEIDAFAQQLKEYYQ